MPRLEVLRQLAVGFAASFVLLAFLLTLLFWFWTKGVVEEQYVTAPLATIETDTATATVVSFPIGVNPVKKNITENPVVDLYAEKYLSQNTRSTILDRFLASIIQYNWYQNLASAVSRILVIYPGQRKEEVVDSIASILKWDTAEEELFLKYLLVAEPHLAEGKFYPGRYVVPVDASPELVAELIYSRFEEEVLERYDADLESVVPLSDALVIASLLEREAYDFTDMRVISGVIWNRLFINMPLQLDATLQYARGGESAVSWWPKVVPEDKFIESKYNTYQNTGLPPAPIANPSVAAIIAALNPRETSCLFYFHDPKGTFYCSETYEAHVQMLKEVYGQGK